MVLVRVRVRGSQEQVHEALRHVARAGGNRPTPVWLPPIDASASYNGESVEVEVAAERRIDAIERVRAAIYDANVIFGGDLDLKQLTD